MRMIMSKKKTKQTNTFLQSKNKKNMKMGSSKTPEYSPIKFDRFGRVCRFVNKKGDVLPTDTEMFGCEIVRDLPYYIRDFVKLIDLGEVIRVPVSNHDGLTGSGKKGRCSMNSHMMSLSLGGHRLYGYCLDQYEETSSSGEKEYFTHLHHHSVWITPEGKTRCVTDYDLGERETGTGLFIPVGLNDFEETFLLGLDDLKISSSKNYVDYLKGGDGDRNNVVERVKKKDLVRYIRKTGKTVFLGKLTPPKDEDSDTWWKKEIEESYFGKVSLSTGRSWDYFKNKLLNTYFPTSQTQ